jgi:hypothetical protein
MEMEGYAVGGSCLNCPSTLPSSCFTKEDSPTCKLEEEYFQALEELCSNPQGANGRYYVVCRINAKPWEELLPHHLD